MCFIPQALRTAPDLISLAVRGRLTIGLGAHSLGVHKSIYGLPAPLFPDKVMGVLANSIPIQSTLNGDDVIPWYTGSVVYTID